MIVNIYRRNKNIIEFIFVVPMKNNDKFFHFSLLAF